MRALTAPGSRVTSTPRTEIDPSSGWRSPSSISTVVVLPAPFGPSRPNTSPAATSKLTPSTALMSPYVLWTSSTRMTGTATVVVVVIGRSLSTARSGVLGYPPRTCRRQGIGSEALAEVRRDVAVVAVGFVQPPSVRPMMPCRDLDEGGAGGPGDPLGLVHELAADAPLAGAAIHDQGEDPCDVIVMLEARQEVDGDEAHDVPVVVSDDDRRMLAREPLESRDDIARASGIALVGEEGGDPDRIADGRRAEDDGGLLDHDPMVAAAAMPNTNGPHGREPWTIAADPSGPGRVTPEAGPGRPR